MTSEPIGQGARILLTGATGFVGGHLRIALAAAGYDLRLASRDPAAARREHPEGTWVHMDIKKPESMEAALEGCDAAYFLVHRVGSGGDYAEVEAEAAKHFAKAASRKKVKRIIYLGGVVPPRGKSSKHLQSRKHTGEILRGGDVPCTELRAAMIVGEGSRSWRILTDLADRLPVMVLPRWLRNHSWPVSIDNVVYALVAALTLEHEGSQWFDLPGEERVSHRESLLRVAKAMGKHPVTIGVPVLSPTLSSYWIGALTSVSFTLARELVQGLKYDLDPSGVVVWDKVKEKPYGVNKAITLALADLGLRETPSSATKARLEALGRAAAHGVAA